MLGTFIYRSEIKFYLSIQIGFGNHSEKRARQKNVDRVGEVKGKEE